MSEYDAVICGAGPAGIATGISTLFYKKDANVVILESRQEVSEEKCGEGISEDWFFHMKGFGKFLKSKLSPKCFENKIYGFLFVLPSGKRIIIRDKKPRGWVLNKDFFLKNLAKVFLDMGGEIKNNTTVKQPIVKDKVVYGVELEDGSLIRGNSVIDATGLNQVIWRKTLDIKEPINKKDVEICCQYKIVDSEIENPELIHFYFGNSFAPGGYGWVFPKSSDRANVGLGCQGSKVLSAFPFQEKFWNMLNMKGKIVSKKGGTVSVFNIPESFVWSNLACVGESARFTNPVHGGGTGPAIFGGCILGKHISEALKKKKSINEALLSYQKEMKSTRGKAHNYHYRAKNLLQSCDDKELEIILSSIKVSEWTESLSFTKREVMEVLGRIYKQSFKLGLKVTRYMGL
jgi:digeranylgeranylglycerophospholipid reductase